MDEIFGVPAAEFRADPYGHYRRMRTLDPVHFIADPGLWALTRYTDVVAALRDERLSAERFQLTFPEMQASALISSFAGMMLLRDPPDHTRLRLLVSKAFTPRVVERLQPRVQSIVDGLIDAVERRGETDLMQSIAGPLPVMVIAELLGLPWSDREQLKRWSDALVILADGSLALAGFPQAEQSAAEFKEYLGGILAERRARPGNDLRDDLISGLLAAHERDDRLTEDELFATCVLLLIAGHETTTNLIGNGMLALLRHPDQSTRLRSDPSLIRSAIEELLRYESPVQLTSRVAKVDLEIGGKPVRTGQEVCLVLGAANRDPAQFADPDRLDLARVDNHHLAFGLGLHFCLGAPLARLEGQIAVASLLRRLPELRLASDAVEWREGIMMRALTALPITW
ncbi:MAG: cytochrome P450 [Deltaproteobacteria bacterium]|nr:cytochrome P450 [Deltaproteobacteria bacterium]MBI3386472.1 cytochrome P450 [Deltaproteobacteria bacterium]